MVWSTKGKELTEDSHPSAQCGPHNDIMNFAPINNI